MRHLLLAASLIALASPAALAQSSPHFPAELDSDIAASLPGPDEVEGMADAAGSAAEALLDVPVGGVVQAIDPGRRVHRDDSIADLSHDPFLRQRVRRSSRRLAEGMNEMMGSVAALTPELRRSLAGFELALDRAVRDHESRRGRRYDRYGDRDDWDYDR